MKEYIKSGFRVFIDYIISLVVFVVFLYMFLAITKDNYSKWIPLYSFLNFLLLYAMLYSDLKKLAVKEKRPQYNLNPYPMKGLIIGLIGFLPLIVIQLIYPLILLNDPVANRIKELALKTLMGPVYFVVRLAGGTTIGYVAASLVVPIVSMFAYMAGFYGFQFRKPKTRPAAKNKKG
ncbi:MAG TPA: hypothetical protein GXX14_02965 [Clostridiaceae bacterium]|nr:hypothetical protein [Clostridiaceae bacterium]